MLLVLPALRALGAETTFVIWAWLVARIDVAARCKVGVLSWPLMLVEALLPLLAVAILLEVAADRQLIFIVDVKKSALVALLAGALQPEDTHLLLGLVFVLLLVQGIIQVQQFLHTFLLELVV
jgi:hypothetical protein